MQGVLLGIVHTIFPFIGDWYAIKLTKKIVELAMSNLNIECIDYKKTEDIIRKFDRKEDFVYHTSGQ